MTSTENTAPAQIVTVGDTSYDFGTKDWTYLQGKPTSSNHELEAQVITQLSGVEISPQQVQALLAMHRFIQKSQANQDRPDFRGRTWESVLKGNQTLAERAAEKHGAVVAEPIGTVVEPEEAPKSAPRKRTPARGRKTPAKASA